MKYKIWDKKSNINDKTALELIGQEQMNNDDVFLIFTGYEGSIIALESVNTLKETYDFKSKTVDEIAAEYIAKQSEKPMPTELEATQQMLFNTQTELLKSQQIGNDMGAQLFNLQTALMMKGVL